MMYSTITSWTGNTLQTCIWWDLNSSIKININITNRSHKPMLQLHSTTLPIEKRSLEIVILANWTLNTIWKTHIQLMNWVKHIMVRSSSQHLSLPNPSWKTKIRKNRTVLSIMWVSKSQLITIILMMLSVLLIQTWRYAFIPYFWLL